MARLVLLLADSYPASSSAWLRPGCFTINRDAVCVNAVLGNDR